MSSQNFRGVGKNGVAFIPQMKLNSQIVIIKEEEVEEDNAFYKKTSNMNLKFLILFFLFNSFKLIYCRIV